MPKVSPSARTYSVAPRVPGPGPLVRAGQYVDIPVVGYSPSLRTMISAPGTGAGPARTGVPDAGVPTPGAGTRTTQEAEMTEVESAELAAQGH